MEEGAPENNWFRIWPAAGQARVRLVCFPYAGVGASMCTGWMEHLEPWIELLAVQLPGRENRLREKPLEDLGPLKTALEATMPQYLDLPVALLGYSFGGTIAFEVARQMVAHDVPPCHLFIAATTAPHAKRRLEPITQLPDAEFINEIQLHFGGIPPEIARQNELLELLLPALRADMRVVETYEYVPGEPLPCPITALGGSDDTVVSMADLSGWGQHTRAKFRHRMYRGGHFFIRDQLPQMLRFINQQLAPYASG